MSDIEGAYPSRYEGVSFAAQQQPNDVFPGVTGSVVEGCSPILQGKIPRGEDVISLSFKKKKKKLTPISRVTQKHVKEKS